MGSYFLPLLKLFNTSPTATMDAMMTALRQHIGHLPTLANVSIASATALATTTHAASSSQPPPPLSLPSSVSASASTPVLLVIEVLVGVYILAGILAANFMLGSASRFDAVEVEVPGNVISEMGALVLFWPAMLSVWLYQGRRVAGLEATPIITTTAVGTSSSSSKNDAGVVDRGDKKAAAVAQDTWDDRQRHRDMTAAAATAAAATSSSCDSANHNNIKRTNNGSRGSSTGGIAGRRKQGFWARHVPSLARMRRQY